MNLRNKLFKLVLLLLSAVIVLQGCRIYHRENTPLQADVRINKEAKVILSDNLPYYFRSLTREGNAYFGAAHKNSASAEYLEMEGYRILERDNYTITFELPVEKVKSVHLKDQTSTTVWTVLLGAGLLIGVGYLAVSNMTIGVGLY